MLGKPVLEFVLTDDHIKLLTNSNVIWENTETGAAAIDPKRPYGSSNVPEDIADLLDYDVLVGDDGLITDQDIVDDLLILHDQTKIALEIVLQTRSFVPGVYERKSPYSSDRWGWEFVGAVEEFDEENE